MVRVGVRVGGAWYVNGGSEKPVGEEEETWSKEGPRKEGRLSQDRSCGDWL